MFPCILDFFYNFSVYYCVVGLILNITDINVGNQFFESIPFIQEIFQFE